jgi:hypothetical protein
VDALAVDTVAEGISLRGSGVRAAITVMDVDDEDNALDCADHALTPAVARGVRMPGPSPYLPQIAESVCPGHPDKVADGSTWSASAPA